MSRSFDTCTPSLRTLLCLAAVVFVVACSAYDSHLLNPNRRPTADSGPSSADAAADSGPSSADAAADSGPSSADAAADAVADDAGAPPADGCVVNPDDDGSCPWICDEICDGADNDCDGETDEDDAIASCQLSNAIAACAEGECLISACTDLFGNCDGDDSNGCERPLNTLTNCGDCDNACAALDRAVSVDCIGGACSATECERGYGDCDDIPSNGCEALLNTIDNCGACGLPCTGASCQGGRCSTLECEPGHADCDGDTGNACETELTTTTDCVVCGNTCSFPNASSSCETGECAFVQCRPGYGDCDGEVSNGCETLLNTTSNCGECGAECVNAGGDAFCTAGVCTTVACEEGLADCDANADNGCETSVRTLANCGLCGVPCTSQSGEAVTCATGVCEVAECAEGEHDCDRDPSNGCESTLRDNDNCGACGNPCILDNATTSCSSGTCELISCNPSFGDCNTDSTDGCETQLGTDANCSSCGDACAEDEFCESGQCQRVCDPANCLCLIPAQFPCCRPDGSCGCAFPFAPCLPTVET